MNIINRRNKIINELKNKEYRDAFAVEQIDTGIPFQVQALREQRGWTQKDLGIHSDMAQETISRIEDPNYGKLTLKTLKRLASAFDVGLMVRFVPFSEIVKWELNLSPGSLRVLSFNEDSYFLNGEGQEETTISNANQCEVPIPPGTTDRVIDFENYRLRKANDSTNTNIGASISV